MMIGKEGKLNMSDVKIIEVLNDNGWDIENLANNIISLKEQVEELEENLDEKDEQVEELEDDKNDLEEKVGDLNEELEDERENGQCSSCQQLKNL